MNMLKLMKYEFRKMRTPLFIMLIILIALQAGFIIGNAVEHDALPAICLMLTTLLVFVVYGYILIAGIASYSRELKDKSGYLIFMAPVRPMSIVCSKLLFTALAAALAAILFGGAAALDYLHLFQMLGFDRVTWAEMSIAFKMAFTDAGITLTQLALMIAYIILLMFIQLILMMCTAYLAITMSATVMQNRRGFWRGLVSFGLFMLLSWGSTRLSTEIADVEAIKNTDELLKMLGINLAYGLGVSALFAWISAILLKKRVSL